MTVDEYLEGAPEPHRSTLRELRSALRGLLPDAEESMSYGVPAFKIAGKAVAGYAHYKKHCSYFPHSGSVLPLLADDLESYDWSRGTLRMPIDHPIPTSLIARLVEIRMTQLGLDQ